MRWYLKNSNYIPTMRLCHNAIKDHDTIEFTYITHVYWAKVLKLYYDLAASREPIYCLTVPSRSL